MPTTVAAKWGSLSASQPGIFVAVLKQIVERVAGGETVSFRPTGNSMIPLIRSRDEVVVSPVDPTLVEVGDIVLTKVTGNVYIHLVKAVEPAKRRVQIGNNRGGITDGRASTGYTASPSQWQEPSGQEQRRRSFSGIRRVTVPATGTAPGHSRCTPFRDYELSTSSAISKKLTVGATPYNPVTLSRSSSVKKASAASCESHT